jgi:hypothetical protein
MATLLRDKMSSEAHINNSERHVRLCQQTQGAESLVANIQPKIDNLQTQVNIRIDKVKARYSAYDGIVFKDGMLDDCIKNLAGSAKQYDRSHPGRPIFTRLFPDGRPSTITDASFTKELSKAEGLLVRLQSLAEENSLHTHEAILSNAIKASRQAVLDHKEAVSEESLAIAEEQMIQAELRKQYEFNYLDATKLFGKNFANRLFPKFTGKKKKQVEEVVVEA